ncbi:murein biosynthesis integral membrane protein MurJ [Methylocaldum sp. GT1BB]|uniref:murein biosynthesis integral membrane protein MurJ n=1 Tax=Methylocaldum sp. GT1BB TaxID=3438963 RepID=UPI003DA07C30
MSKHLLKSTAAVGGMTFVSRLLGFVRDVVIARYFGADPGTDAFFVAFRIPNFLRRLFAEGAFSQAFVPVLSDYKERHDPTQLRPFLDRTAGSLSLALLLVTFAGIIAAPVLIMLFAPGFYRNAEQFELSVEMLRITLPYLFFISLTAFAGAILNTWGRFAIPAFTPVFLNLLMIAAAIWFAPYLSEPIIALAWGVLIAGVVQLAFQVPALLREGLLPKPRLGFHDAGVRRIIKMIGPAIFGVSVTQVNLLVDTVIASFLVSGSVSWLYYSDRLVEFPLGIFGVAIGTVMLPHLSKNHANRDRDGFSRSLDWALRWVILIGLPATLGLALLAEPMISTLFQYDRFSSHDAEMASRSLTTYSIGLMGFIAIKVLVPGFSSRQDLRTPVRYGVYAIIANLALNLALIFQLAPIGWGHAGLALSTALAALLNAGLLLAKLLKEQIYKPEPGWPIFLLRVALASGVMVPILVYASNAYPWQIWSLADRISHLALWILLGLATYLSCLTLTGLRPRHMLVPEGT